MTKAFLNGEFLPLSEAKISPLDRGFLFGDGIYEVIPTYKGKMVGFDGHMKRFSDGLGAIEIKVPLSTDQWQSIIDTLVYENQAELGDNIGIYLQISRGADTKRYHAFPENVEPTVFAFAFTIAPPPVADRKLAKAYTVALTQDLRWQRCHIKSTALLGNVLHFQYGRDQGCSETILFNGKGEVTEASSSNVFVVLDGQILTPPLDNQILPGITRNIAIQAMKKANLPIAEQIITLEQLKQADEVWLTSSSKELQPVTVIDGKPVGKGEIGPVWEAAQQAYSQYKFEL
jgi:D-alanine transaminase